MSLFSELKGVGEEFRVFVGRQSVALARSSLCSVVSSLGGMGSMLVMWLILFVMFIFAPSESCWVEGVAV